VPPLVHTLAIWRTSCSSSAYPASLRRPQAASTRPPGAASCAARASSASAPGARPGAAPTPLPAAPWRLSPRAACRGAPAGRAAARRNAPRSSTCTSSPSCPANNSVVERAVRVAVLVRLGGQVVQGELLVVVLLQDVLTIVRIFAVLRREKKIFFKKNPFSGRH
jgi:hypothetical protein